MSTRPHTFITDEYYHIYNRGNSKQLIFLDEQDYSIFQEILYLMNMEKRITFRDIEESPYSYVRGQQLVHIGAYCLMPNHFHILLLQKKDKGISKFMLKVSTAYVMYFNKKYTKTGSLFEGTFKSKHIDNDRYLKYIYSYIHLNPIKLVKSSWKEDLRLKRKISIQHATHYPFSSIGYYLGRESEQNKILDTSSFPQYFPKKSSFLKEVLIWISYKE